LSAAPAAWAGTLRAATLAAFGFTAPERGDFSLSAASPFRGLGADVPMVHAMTAGARALSAAVPDR
jgi:hypothetical protein